LTTKKLPFSSEKMIF